MHVTIPWNFDHLLYVWENVFLFCAALARRTFRINHKKNCSPFVLILTEVWKVLQNVLGNPWTTQHCHMQTWRCLKFCECLTWSFVGDALLLILWKWKVLGLPIWQDWQSYFNSGNNIGIETLLNYCGNIHQIWTASGKVEMCVVSQFCIESYTLYSDFDSFLNMTAYYLQAHMAV